MTDTKLAKRRSTSISYKYNATLTFFSIIQDCEDALTNWVTQNAAVSSKLSTRARTLSQRRKNRIRGDGIDLSHQDQAMDRESGLWVPASEHRAGDEYEDEEEEEEEGSSAINGDSRGREEQRIAA
jgi:hypothetical protein